MSATYSKSSRSRRSKVQSPENFLEALRTLGSDAVSETKTQIKKAITSDIPESFGLAPSGTLRPNEDLSVNQLQQAERKGYNQAEAEYTERLMRMRQAEHSQLLREEAASKQQIQSILQEIRSLAKTVGDFAQEVQVATLQAPINPGLYHKNFYAHLKSVIATIRQKVESSKNWLAATNGRASKKGYYWSQVGKSGTKYMLSSERYMVTSTG